MNVTDINIRPAVFETDFDAIAAMFRAVMETGETNVYPADLPDEKIRENWMGEDRRAYVALEGTNTLDGVILGTYTLRPNHTGRGSHVANASYIVPDHARGRGIGKRMGEHSLLEAKRLGYTAMQFNMVVASNTRAIKLWEALGFKIIGSNPKAFRHETLGLIDTHIMHRYL